MCCEQLVCASCAQPVVRAGCSVCRAARAQLHTSAPALNIALLAVVVTALLAIAAVLYGQFGG